MKKRILLVDESLTVQKVVALTLDKAKYAIYYAKSRSEAMKMVMDSPPDLILVSDQVADVTVGSFPKEVEAWFGRKHPTPPVILITGQDLKEMKHYSAVIRKPFSPQTLQKLVQQFTPDDREALSQPRADAPMNENDEQSFQRAFNDAFADEARLVRDTFQAEIDDSEKTLVNIPRSPVPSQEPADGNEGVVWSSEDESEAPQQEASVPPPQAQLQRAKSPLPSSPRPGAAPAAAPKAAPAAKGGNDLWGPTTAVPAQVAKKNSGLMGASDSMAYKAVLESQVEEKIESQDLEQVVDKVLERLVPPIVERLVQERLDRLLAEHENFEEAKP